MSTKDLFYPKDHRFSDDEEKEYAREKLVYNVTEDILVRMELQGMSKAKLADLLGTSRSYISQLLNGSANMSLNKLSDICWAIGIKPVIGLQKTESEVTNWHSAHAMPLLGKLKPNTAKILPLRREHSSRYQTVEPQSNLRKYG